MVLRSSNAPSAREAPFFELVAPIDLGGPTSIFGAPNPSGLMGQAWIAVDRNPGPLQGNVYVLGSVNPPGGDRLDVMFIRSTDRGLTWSEPLRIHDDPIGAWQWFGTMSVAPNGRIDAVWNDTRSDLLGRISELYYAYSADGGLSWSQGLPVSPSFDSWIGWPNQAKLGDYYHMVSDKVAGNLAYAATFNGEQDVYFLRVGDCNANERHDADDIAVGSSADCNRNGIADECEESEVVCLPCAADADCDDGWVCNGAESCDAEECRPGAPPSCDDGRDCTLDRCREPDGACEWIPTPLCCGDGICDAYEDCVSCESDCDGRATGRPRLRFCCGDGITQPAEGDGAVCDGNP